MVPTGAGFKRHKVGPFWRGTFLRSDTGKFFQFWGRAGLFFAQSGWVGLGLGQYLRGFGVWGGPRSGVRGPNPGLGPILCRLLGAHSAPFGWTREGLRDWGVPPEGRGAGLWGGPFHFHFSPFSGPGAQLGHRNFSGQKKGTFPRAGPFNDTRGALGGFPKKTPGGPSGPVFSPGGNGPLGIHPGWGDSPRPNFFK